VTALPNTASLGDRQNTTATSTTASTDLRNSPIYEDADLLSLQSRALAYLEAGVPVHLRGPAGIGKTTLAIRIAGRLGRPLSIVTGDKWVSRADLVGREVGQISRRVEDAYINRVRRTESQTRAEWRDAVLTRAVREGHTFVYDEFTRATPEANATLLPVLEEGFLVLRDAASDQSAIRAHPDFRVVLTSNPHDYVGVENAPDALLDRMITFDLDTLSATTETGIVAARSGLALREAGRIVSLVRALRRRAAFGLPPSIRATVMIARLVRAQGLAVDRDDPRFLQICIDVLRSRQTAVMPTGLEALLRELLAEVPGDDDRVAP